MMRTIVLGSVALVLSAGFASAADEASKPSSCAFVRSIDRWERIDDTHAYIYTSPRRKFKLTFFAPCRDLKWAIFARVDTRPSSATCLSVGDTLVFGRGGLMPSNRWEFEERCTITAIEPVPRDGEKPADAPPAP
ncbi:MAG: DUF6491 family protein [Alphaproteobacteria bacterium]|jgi:hypothetical protein|nr:DUF6491 family protein [Alphaproteobacteria bacterium]